VIRACSNTLYHREGRPGLFLIEKPNQRYCSPRCELPENGLYSVGILINGVSIEAEFARHEHTPQHLLDMMKGQSSHGILSPDPNAPVVPETLVFPMEVEQNETNRAFVERTSILLSPDPETDKLSSIFKPPCSDVTVQEFLDGKPPPAFFDVTKDWVMRMKCDSDPYETFDMNALLWDQLDPYADKWINEEGKKLLLVELVERAQLEQEKAVAARKISVTSPPPPVAVEAKEAKAPLMPAVLPSPKKMKATRKGPNSDPKTQEERDLLAWFERHGFDGMTMPRARDKKTLYIRVEGGVAVASLYGKTYYDAFLKDFAAQKPNIVSPFVAQRAWVFFPFDTEKAREDWITHYDQVREACPQRSFGPLKYLMTEDLMEAYPKYSKYVMDDPEKNLLYQDMVNDYSKLEKANFIPYDGTVKLDKKPKKRFMNTLKQILKQKMCLW
jgi:hypothetical protein